MNTYQGRISVDYEVFVRQDEGEWRPLPPRLDVENRSPSGFSWGYQGSGPAQLALAILCMEIGDERAVTLYQQFKFEVIAGLHQDRNWSMTSDDVMAWVEKAKGYGQ